LMSITVKQDWVGRRLDICVSLALTELTRSRAKQLIESGNVRLSGKTVTKASHVVKAGEDLDITIPPPEQTTLEAEDIDLEILYQDKDIAVVNKPAHMVVHPGAGNKTGTLVHALLHHCKDLSGIGGELRPGIVHRLDKGTSGVMVVAKNDQTHANLSAQFKARNVEKHYIALVYGKVAREKGTITTPIGRHVSDRKKMSTKTNRGRIAETHYAVKERIGNDLTLVDIRLGTGRTHQIRVHFSHLGHPLVGDDLYGGKAIKRLKNNELYGIINILSRPFLHAYRISFHHPRTGKRIEFTAPPPSDLTSLLDELRKVKDH